MHNKKLIILSMLFVSLTVAGTFLLKPREAVASKSPIPSLEEPKLKADTLITNDLPSQKEASQLGKDIAERWNEKIKKNEGWLHLVYQVNSEIDNGVILPDGSPMPSSYIEDSWYLLNKQGLVEKHVVTLKDKQGNILQQSVFVGNMETNLTFGYKMESLTPYELKLDRGFLQYLVDAESLKISIKNQDVKYKNKSHKEFSFTETYDQPTQFNNGKDLVKGSSVSGLFSNETGQLTLYRKIWKYNNGEDVLFEECELLFTEFTSTVPSDILIILESVQ